MAEDVTVSFGADDSALSQAIAKIKASMTELDAKAIALGKTISEAFAKMGITQAAGFKLAGPEEQQALAQYWASLDKVKTKVDEVADAHGKMGQATRSAGIDFGSMAERMAFRLVIFEAIRLAIQGIKYAFDQISNLQQARLQFDAMSDSTDHLAARFQYLKEGADAAFVPIEKAVQARNVLQDYGASIDQAAMITKDLDKWSQILGVDVVKLAESLGRVSQGEGSLADMRLVTRMMGDQAAAGRGLIQTYENLLKAQKNLETEQATAAKSMDAVMRSAEKMGEQVNRQTDRQLSAREKLAGAQADWDKKFAGGTMTGEQLLTKQFMRAAGGGESQLEAMQRLQKGGSFGAVPPLLPRGASQEQRNAIKSQIDLFRQGYQELEKEFGTVGLKSMIAAGMPGGAGGGIGFGDIIEAGKQARADAERGLREDAEAGRAHAEFQKTEMTARVAGTKADLSKQLPQAVTAPPAAQWTEFANSIKGLELLTKTQFDTGIQKVVTELGNVTKASNGTTTAVGGLENLFRSG